MYTVIALLDPEHCIISALSTPNKVHLQLSGNSRNGGNFLYLTFCCHSEETLKTYTTCLKECPLKMYCLCSRQNCDTPTAADPNAHCQHSLKGKGYMFFKLFSIFWGDFLLLSHITTLVFHIFPFKLSLDDIKKIIHIKIEISPSYHPP